MSMTSRRTPTVSVIIPNWNCAPWLPETLGSLLRQSSPPEEIIIIDDGSSDDSVAWLTAFAAQHPQVTLLSGGRGGVSAARMKGLAAASGDFVYFMDADDFVSTELFADFRRVQARHPEIDLFCFGAKMFFDLPAPQRHYQTIHQRHVSGLLPGGSATLRTLIQHQSAHRVIWSSIISRRLIDQLDLQFLPIQNHEDAPFMFALYLQARALYCTSQSYYYKRFMLSSLSQSTRDFSWVKNYFIARAGSEQFLQQQQLPHDEALLDDYYQTVMHGCLTQIRKNHMTVPAEWQPQVNQLVRKVLQHNARLKLLWYCPAIYSGLQACRDRLGRYSARR
ncbi:MULTISPECIES: glycosyltransferase family 2 protein [Pantoea]|jgi:glycosyltransferase involved in cell wall biosynthesis|uniref:glycosyltransferase family 2 protein n=1 Tax=Pantoea TaxID=53335 RepID=UPI00073769F9|nr:MULTISPECIES: glycosyltransferase family A protein [Pantoea]MBK4770867.1 glycosyltransferase family 2 protein [Pantoea sp. Morm]KAA6103875.1 glycosyltransferase family 2 protein [Pantoea sp. B_9]KAA6116082.1 glycosyltransferase family 2 protein [Pantoea sp. B_10]KTS32840.1 glycosyltransferase [Pantoea dispersa]KTS59287.1 glycosyltransferase [Pantoea dispersa]